MQFVGVIEKTQSENIPIGFFLSIVPVSKNRNRIPYFCKYRNNALVNVWNFRFKVTPLSARK